MTDRRACKDWPTILNPAPGCFPPACESIRTERVLHLACGGDQSDALSRALASLGPLWTVRWNEAKPLAVQDAIGKAAREHWPTLVVMQIQRGGSPLTPAYVADLRTICAPECVIVNFDGDVYQAPGEDGRRWFVDLGRVCDASLLVTTSWQAELAAAGVRHPGFLGVGVDADLYKPVGDCHDVPPIVALANGHGPRYPLYAHRDDLFARVATRWPGRFRLYGSGWERSTLPASERLGSAMEAATYSSAGAALCISMRSDLARYTSDRLIRCLCSGGVPVVEAFPDMAGLGLQCGINCLSFTDWAGLQATIECVLGWLDLVTIRQEARELGLRHSWLAHMPELRAIVEAVREAR